MITRKQIKEKAKEIEQSEKQVYDEEGRAVINLNIMDDSDFLSPYGEDGDVLLSSETGSFIEHATRPINHKKELSLVLKGNITEKEEVLFEKGIRNYYENTFMELQKKIKTNLAGILWLTLAGLVYFAVLIAIAHFVGYTLLIEMISIAGWVFLWEAVDLLCFQRPKLKRKLSRTYALMNAKITFEPKKEIKKSQKKVTEKKSTRTKKSTK